MNVKTAIALILAAAVTAPGFAADTSVFHDASPVRTKVTRAEVKAEVLRARAAGLLDFSEVNYPLEQPAAKSTLTRAEVKAEVLRARAAGELDITEASENYPFN